MEGLKFIHAADLHIDSPFKGMLHNNKSVAKALQEATYQAFENLIDLCLKLEVDFLLVAGDIYDGADRIPRAQFRFRDGLQKLSDSGIDTFVVHGNHDPLEGRFDKINWPERVHTFGETPSWEVIRRGEKPIANIQGVSYPRQVVTENLIPQFTSPPSKDLFNIGLLHCNVGGIANHDNYAPCTVNDLSQKGMDYWALGHIHTTQILKQGDPLIVYPGNIQGRHPGEKGIHGCFFVEVSSNGNVRTEFKALDVIRWESSDISIEAFKELDDLIVGIAEKLESLRMSSDGRNVVCRLTLSGRGPLHSVLSRVVTEDSLLEEVNRKQHIQNPWIWVERLDIKTRPEIDLTVRSGQDDFLGSILREAESADPEIYWKPLEVLFSARRDSSSVEERNALVSSWMEEARWLLAEKFEVQE